MATPSGCQSHQEQRIGARRTVARSHHSQEVASVKNCKLCRYSKVCNDLPGICILIPYVAIAVVAIAVAYLFVTQELL